MGKGSTRGRTRRSGGYITRFQRARYFFRFIAFVVLLAFTGLYFQPVALAVHLDPNTTHAPTPPANEARLADALERLEQRLEKHHARLAQRLASTQPPSVEESAALADDQSQLGALRQELDTLDAQAIEDFNQIEQHLITKNLPQVILDRHYEAVATYRQEMATLKVNLDAAQLETDTTQRELKVKQVKEHLKAKQKKHSQPFDPSNPPTKSLQPNRNNTPKLTKEEFVSAGLYDNPTVKVAAVGDFTFDRLAGASDPAYLTATPEIVLTDVIKAKAAKLEFHPVKIFNWVYNNLEWNPNWGAIQSAEHTLGSREGNAIDLAGTLIALLRASGIPARYVHGVVEMDPERFKSLVGNFESIEAALDFASASGIPLVSQISGGKVSKVIFEHVWVEAAIDFSPSRGAINLAADQWIALDPSTKKIQRFVTPNYGALSGVNAESVMQQFASSGTSDPQAGWRQGLDVGLLEQGFTFSPDALSQIASASRTFFQNTYRTSDTVGLAQISAGIRIEPRTESVLPASLPYRVRIVGARYGHIPPALQGRATISFGLDIIGEPISPVTVPLARVNNEKLTMSFTFASAADHDTYVSFIPTGTVTSLSQLPASIPGYLISVVPEIRLRDDILTSASPVKLGAAVTLFVSTQIPGVQGKDRISRIIAGSHLAVLIFAGSANIGKFKRIHDRFGEAGTVLSTGTVDDVLSYAPNFINRLTSDTFYGGALEYFAKRLTIANLITKGVGNGRFQLASGVATFGYVPTPRFQFGIPRSLALGTLQVDAPNLLLNAQSSSGNPELRKLMMLQMGVLGSSLEADVPAFLWSSDLSTPPTGASATNNIRTALRGGQRIYRITQQNRSSIGQLQLSPSALESITTAVDAGLEVITHQSPIVVSGRAGNFPTAGIIALDPVTGVGQYLLDNDTNGGLANTADEMMATCAYVNRPGFVDNDVDWARFQITRRCAEVSRTLKEQAVEANTDLMQAKFEAVKEFHEVYAKVPMVIADCIVAGAPLLLSEMLILIRTAAAMLAIQTADMRSITIAEHMKDLADQLKDFVTAVHSFCVGEQSDLFD